MYLIVLSLLLGPVSEEDVLRHQAEMDALEMQAKLYQTQLKALSSTDTTEPRQLAAEVANFKPINFTFENEGIFRQVNQNLESMQAKLDFKKRMSATRPRRSNEQEVEMQPLDS